VNNWAPSNFFLQYWGLNSGLHTCYSGTLPLEPLTQPGLPGMYTNSPWAHPPNPGHSIQLSGPGTLHKVPSFLLGTSHPSCSTHLTPGGCPPLASATLKGLVLKKDYSALPLCVAVYSISLDVASWDQSLELLYYPMTGLCLVTADPQSARVQNDYMQFTCIIPCFNQTTPDFWQVEAIFFLRSSPG
jgi:hypothetical protein